MFHYQKVPETKQYKQKSRVRKSPGRQEETSFAQIHEIDRHEKVIKITIKTRLNEI